MKKYFYILRNEIKALLMYKADAVLQILAPLVTLCGILIFIDKGIYTSTVYQGLQLKTYYIFAFILSIIITPDVAFSVSDDIETGNLNKYLIMPVSYIKIKFCQHIRSTLPAFPLFVGLILLSYTKITEDFLMSPPNLDMLVFIVVIIFLGELLLFFAGFIIGLLSAWFTKIQGTFYVFILVIQIISGTIIPLDMFPKGIAMYFEWNPFSYMIFYPINMYLGNTQQYLQRFCILLIWLVCFFIIVEWLWVKARKSYQGYGG